MKENREKKRMKEREGEFENKQSDIELVLHVGCTRTYCENGNRPCKRDE